MFCSLCAVNESELEAKHVIMYELESNKLCSVHKVHEPVHVMGYVAYRCLIAVKFLTTIRLCMVTPCFTRLLKCKLWLFLCVFSSFLIAVIQLSKEHCKVWTSLLKSEVCR